MADAKYLSYGFAYVNAVAFTNHTINGPTDKVEWVLQMYPGVVVTKLGFRYGLRALTPVQHKIGIQGVDASGNPDGTFKGGGSPNSGLFTPPADTTWDGTWRWVTLDNAYTVPNNDNYVAIVIEPVGTPDGSNNSSFTTRGGVSFGFPYAIHNDAGVRTRQSVQPIFGYASATKAYGRILQAATSHTFNSGSATDEYAIKFTIPAGWCDTYKLIGVQLIPTLTAAGSCLIQLYGGTDTTAANSTGAVTEKTVHQAVTHDQDFAGATFAADSEIWFDESTLATLYAGATYRLGFQPSATNITIPYYSVATASDWEAWEGGTDFAKSGRDSGAAGDWTDTTTDRIVARLVLADITEPAGGGGGGLKLVGAGGLAG